MEGVGIVRSVSEGTPYLHDAVGLENSVSFLETSNPTIKMLNDVGGSDVLYRFVVEWPRSLKVEPLVYPWTFPEVAVDVAFQNVLRATDIKFQFPSPCSGK